MPDGSVMVRLHRAVAGVLSCTLPQLFTAAGAAVAMTFVWWLIIPGIPPSQSGGDTDTYIEMARDPKEVHWAPLAFRGLEPWLAHGLGHPFHQELLAFRLLNWGSLMASALVVFSGWFVVVPFLLVLTGLARETVIGYALPIYMWIRHRLVDLGAVW